MSDTSKSLDETSQIADSLTLRVRDLELSANSFSRAMTSAFAISVTGGKQFDDVLKSLALRLSSLSLNLALKSVQNSIAGGIENLLSGLTGTSASASTAVAAASGVVKPFASGGVIGTPTYFPLVEGGVGLAGEAGPEAIMPLRRGPDGQRRIPAASAARKATSPGRSRVRSRAASAVCDRHSSDANMPSSFHEILFPLDIALKSAGGPERRTEIVAFGSGREQRNARWAHSRRRYDAGYGVKMLPPCSRWWRSSRNGAANFAVVAGATGSIIPRQSIRRRRSIRCWARVTARRRSFN